MLILDANFLQSKDPQLSGARCCDSPKDIWLRKEASLDVSFYLLLRQEPSVHALLLQGSRGRPGSTRDRQLQPFNWLTISGFAVKRQAPPHQTIPSALKQSPLGIYWDPLEMISEVQRTRGDIIKGNYGAQLTARLTPDPFPLHTQTHTSCSRSFSSCREQGGFEDATYSP